MNPIKTFHKGGVHPEENKFSADQPIQDFPMPKQIIVPLGQCLGAPAECIVNKGDRVLTGHLSQRPLPRHWYRCQNRRGDGPYWIL